MKTKNKPPGRPRKYKTEDERLAAKREQNRRYQETVKKERYERYHSDPKYREGLLAGQRKSYRMQKGIKVKKFGGNHSRVHEFAFYRKVKLGGKFVRRLTLTPYDMATFFEITKKAFGGWISTGKFPRPHLRTEDGGYAYTHKQAAAMAKAMGENMKGKSAFRSTDAEAIKATHSAFMRTHAKP